MALGQHIVKDTADIRAKLLEIWKLIDAKQISASEARLHISLARAVLETMKIEIAYAHLTQTQIPPMPISGRLPAPTTSRREQ
jgi:hypothetical protein